MLKDNAPLIELYLCCRLTAYVLKTFSILGQTDYTEVDFNTMYRSFKYLTGVKAPDGGSFIEHGRLIHKEMMVRHI